MLFIAAFLLVLGVNATLIFFAQRTFSGLETASPYERGLDYNRTLAAEAAQAKLGWQHEAAFAAGDGSGRTLTVRMTDRDGRPLDGLALSAYLVRPSSEGLDMTLTVQATGDGRYVAHFALPAPGQWELRVVARGSEHVWQVSERMVLQ
jgi:nitrogen fixation protein FixH